MVHGRWVLGHWMLGPAVALGLTLAACGADASGGSAATTATTASAAGTPVAPVVPGPAAVAQDSEAALRGQLLQFRRDVASGRLEVRLTSLGRGLFVEELELRAPGISTAPWAPRPTELRTRVPRDLPVLMGDPDCAMLPGPPQAEVVLRDDTGARRSVTLPLDDGGLVDRLHAVLCADQTLRAQADVEVAAVDELSTWAGPALRVVVRLSRLAGTDPVRVTGIGSNTIYSISAAGPLPTLGGAGPVTVALDLVPARCDEHALGESYRTGLIGLFLALGDADPRPFVLTPDAGVRHRLENFAVETCRAGQD